MNRVKVGRQTPAAQRGRWYPVPSVGLAILAVILAVSCSSAIPVPISVVPAPEQPPPVPETPLPEQLPPASNSVETVIWEKIETFTGQESMTTPVFHASGEKWRIVWDLDAENPEYAVFDLFVCPEENPDIYTRKITHSGSSSGDTICNYRGNGNYFIKVVAANLQKWTIMVEDHPDKASLSPIQITHIHYKGRDLYQSTKEGYETIEADEYVEIKNLSDSSVRLSGWRLTNITKGLPVFVFPHYFPYPCENPAKYDEDCVQQSPCVLEPHQRIRIYTGEIHLEYGGLTFHYYPGDIWNNLEPDTAVLYNSKWEEVSRKSYAVPSPDHPLAPE